MFIYTVDTISIEWEVAVSRNQYELKYAQKKINTYFFRYFKQLCRDFQYDLTIMN